MGSVSVAFQYLFNGRTRFAHCPTFVTGRPDHPRLTTRIDEKPKPCTLAAPDKKFHAQVVLAPPRPGIQVVTYSIHFVSQRNEKVNVATSSDLPQTPFRTPSTAIDEMPAKLVYCLATLDDEEEAEVYLRGNSPQQEAKKSPAWNAAPALPSCAGAFWRLSERAQQTHDIDHAH